MPKAMRKIAFVLFAVMLVLAGCSSSQKPVDGKASTTGNKAPEKSSADSAKTDAGKQGKSLKVLHLGVPHKVLFTVALPVYIAQEKGFYEEAGVKVDTIFTKGGGDTVQGVITGDLDIALETGPMAVMSAYLRGAPLKIISASGTGFDFFWYAKGDSPYKSWKDMAGKKIGFSSPGSSTEMGVRALNAMMKKEGLKEMQGIAVGSPPDQITAVLTGQIDAGFSTAPTGFKEMGEGKLKIAIKGSDMTDYNNVAIRVNFANAKFVKESPDTVRGFLAAHQKAIDWIFAHHEEAMEIWKKKGGLKEDAKTLLKTFDYYTPRMVRLAPLDGIPKIVEDAITYKFIDKAPSEQQLKDLFDLQYAPKK